MITLRESQIRKLVKMMSNSDDGLLFGEFDRLEVQYGWSEANELWQEACRLYDDSIPTQPVDVLNKEN